MRLSLAAVPLAWPLLRERERDRERDLERDLESSRGVTERAWDFDRVSSSAAGGVGERPRETLRLSDIVVVIESPRCSADQWGVQ